MVQLALKGKGESMTAQVLRGSKQEIADKIVQMFGEIREVIVIVEEPIATPPAPGEDIFAEMAPYMVDVGDADFSRESIYTRMEGE
jgi:hypothetical protein